MVQGRVFRALFSVIAGGVLSIAAAGCASEDDPGDNAAEDALVTGNGITTCGAAGNDRCDAKIAVKVSDAKTVLLGKYDVTAGRFRTFLAATSGNVRGYIKANKPLWWNGTWAPALATGTGVGNLWADASGYAYDWSTWLPENAADANGLLGPYTWGIRAGDMALADAALGYTGKTTGAKAAIDWNIYGPGNEGCGVNDFGARTYWQPNGSAGEDNRYAQADLDKKALNCVNYYMLQAFCAWDGGRLPTFAELNASWGPETYPWGEAVPYYADYDGRQITNGAKDLANYGNAAGAVYTVPETVDHDMSNRVSVPGAFPKGNGPYGHADVVGNVINITGDIAQGTAKQTNEATHSSVVVTNAPVVKWFRNGSWEGHPVGDAYTFIATNRYIAMGGRCAYDKDAPDAAAFPMGFRAEYFAGTGLLAANSKGTRVDPYVAFNAASFKNPAAPTASTAYSVRWTAKLLPRYTQTYTFKSVSGDGVRLWIGDKLVIDDWTTHATKTKTGTIALKAGTPYPIKIEHYNAAGNGTVTKVLWSSQSQGEQVIPPSQLTPSP